MLYYIYIGNNGTAISHLNAITDGMFVSVSSINKAAKVINDIRERYNTSTLYKQISAKKDYIGISYFHKKFPRVYIILITRKLQIEHHKAHLQTGVSNTLPLQANKESIQRMSQFLQIRQQHKTQEFSETRRKALGTFHLPLRERIFDVLFSLNALVVLSLLFIGTIITIRLGSKGGVTYKSRQVGSNYRIFNFLKFRSTYTNADKRLKEFNALNQYQMEEEVAEDTSGTHFDDLTGSPKEGVILPTSDGFTISEKDFLKQKAYTYESPFIKTESDPCIIHIGRSIRRYSMDELPQLLNILKGGMNIIGNRPLPLYEAELLTSDAYIDRFMAPFGLIGPQQVEKRSGAGKMSAEERKQLDIKYT